MYIIGNNENDEFLMFENAHGVADYIVELKIATDDLDEYLDNKYGNVVIAGYSISTSHALKMTDRCAYHAEFDKLKERERRYIVNELECRSGDFTMTFHANNEDIEVEHTRYLEKKKLKIGSKTYTEFYEFDGDIGKGQYFTEDGATSCESWIALMDDGSLMLLFNGKHIPYDAEYEIIGQEAC